MNGRACSHIGKIAHALPMLALPVDEACLLGPVDGVGVGVAVAQ
jgi:hypothetical protein